MSATTQSSWEQRLGVTRRAIDEFCRRWGIAELSLFGSVVRDDFTGDSDVDVLVRLDPSHARAGWDWVDMKEELESLFHRRVDLTSPRILENPFRRASIERDLQKVYAA